MNQSQLLYLDLILVSKQIVVIQCDGNHEIDFKIDK